MVPGILHGGRYQVSWSSCIRGAFLFLISSCVFSHDGNATYEYCRTIVLAALLAAVIEFCLVCLVFGLCCCTYLVAFVRFWSVCFPFVFPYVVEFFSVFPPVHVFGGRRERRCSFFCCRRWFSFVPFVLCVLSVKYL